MNNTLVKGIKLVDTLAHQGRPMGVSELAAATNFPKSGVHRLLQALVDEGLVYKDDAGYGVTLRLWQLGSAALLGSELRRRAQPLMQALTEATGESVHLSVLDGHHVVCVHKVDSARTVPAYSQIGGRAPAHRVATGRAILAYQPPHWLASVSRAIFDAEAADPAAFIADMREIRRDGYAFNEGRLRKGVNGLAAPIFDGAHVIASIGLSGPAATLHMERVNDLADDVVCAAHGLSADLRKATPHSSLFDAMCRWSRTPATLAPVLQD